MTTLLRLILLPLLAVPVLVLATAPTASACSCEPIDADAPRQWGEQVFVATLVESTPDDAQGEVRVDAVVTHVYRGEPAEEVQVQTYAGETSCGSGDLEAGETRLFEASGDEAADGVVHVGFCGGSPFASDEVIAEVEEALGPGEAREVPTPDPDPLPESSAAPAPGGSDWSAFDVTLLLGGLLVGASLVVVAAAAVVRPGARQGSR